MGFINGTSAGNWRAFYRDPSGKQKSKTFRTKREAKSFLAEIETQKAHGSYISPHAGKEAFGDHAERWMRTWNTEITTAARDRSVLRNHVLPKWGSWQLGNIDHMAVQEWVTELCAKQSRAVVSECHRLTSGVLRSAVRNRLLAHNPADDVRIPKRRKRDTDERIISRDDFRRKLLPAVPEYYRALVATAGGAGLRWGEVAGLCEDAIDLDAGTLKVIRTVVEVSGNTSFKAFPKSAAGRRVVPLPPWVLRVIREHLDAWPTLDDQSPVFANMAGNPHRRTLFRARVWRPALVRAGLLGEITEEADGSYWSTWQDPTGERQRQKFPTEAQAVKAVAGLAAGGLKFHDLRHSYATWLVDDGVPVNMVQRVLGHERSSTTLDLYTRRTDGGDRILDALRDDDDGDGGMPASTRR